jgi:hypothetical protein
MKLSVILVSVNIAATLPLAVATGASAQEQAKSDTAAWLKSSLASLDTTVNQKKQTKSGKKISYSTPTADNSGANGLHGHGFKMRAFVPNRKLPSQRDLDVEFIAQTAKMAAAQQEPDLTAMTPRMAEPALSGKVSEVYNTVPNSAGISNYGSVGYVKQSSSRVVPGQIPSAPGQIRQFKGAKRTKYVPQSVQPLEEADMEEPAQDWRPSAQPARTQFLQQQQAFAPQQPMFRAPQQLQPVQAPPQLQSMLQAPSQPVGITADEQAIIDRMMGSGHQSQAGSATPMSMMPHTSSAGPAPFPLSLLPQDSLKSIIGGMRRPANSAPPSYFGSWRGSMSNLPAAGFHNYSQHAAPRHAAARIASHPSSHPSSHPTSHPTSPLVASHPAHAGAAHSTGTQSVASVSQGKRSMAQLRRLAPHDYNNIAQYPPYPGVAAGMAY